MCRWLHEEGHHPQRLELPLLKLEKRVLQTLTDEHYLRHGGDIVHLSTVLGHTQITTTQRYLHLVTEDLIVSHQKVSILRKAVEVLDKITRAVVQRSFPDVTIEGAFERDSKETLVIQLCDVLLGAVMSTWDREPAGGAKAEQAAFVAEHLGWRDLRADTRPTEREFNVWMFYDKERGMRQATTREVRLRYPLR